MNWRTMTTGQMDKNPTAYWRSKFLESKRAYPKNNTMALTEYGFIRLQRSRQVLHTLAKHELDIKVIKDAREMTW